MENAVPELEKTIKAIIARHKTMLSELDKKAAKLYGVPGRAGDSTDDRNVSRKVI